MRHCHVPISRSIYLGTKIRAVKDIYGEMVGTIDTPEKYEAHKLAMAQSVPKTLKRERSHCRPATATTPWTSPPQRPEARPQHPVAIKQGETCIDCHMGVAHIPPGYMMGENPGRRRRAGEKAAALDRLWIANDLHHRHRAVLPQRGRQP